MGKRREKDALVNFNFRHLDKVAQEMARRHGGDLIVVMVTWNAFGLLGSHGFAYDVGKGRRHYVETLWGSVVGMFDGRGERLRQNGFYSRGDAMTLPAGYGFYQFVHDNWEPLEEALRGLVLARSVVQIEGFLKGEKVPFRMAPLKVDPLEGCGGTTR